MKQPSPTPGSERWVAYNLKSVDFWLQVRQAVEGRKASLKNDITKEDIAKYSANCLSTLKLQWPLVTTEASATDRVSFFGLINPYLIYTGASNWDRAPRITYDNTTREFAAAVMASDRKGFRVMYYSLTPDAPEIGILPWELEPGATYKLRYGPDADGDVVMDSLTDEREFVLAQRGTPIRVKVEPRVTYIIEVDQMKPANGAPLAPDPAISASDIRYEPLRGGGIILAKVHNVGAKDVRNVEVAFYDGDPEAGGTLLGTSTIPNIEAPNDLGPRTATVGVNWTPTKESHDIYIVVDPNHQIVGEITTFNNVAHNKLPRE